MSSNIRVNRICEHCGKEFEARKTTSKTCSDDCAKRAYKARQRAAKVEISNEQVKQVKAKPVEVIRAKDFLTVRDVATLLGSSRQTIYSLIQSGKLPAINLKVKKTLIRRSDIDRLFDQPAEHKVNLQSVLVPLADCYTMKEIQQKYGISDKALYELIRRNDIPKQYSGIYAYVPKVRIDELLANTPVQP